MSSTEKLPENVLYKIEMILISVTKEFAELASGFIFAEFMLSILVMGSIGICLIIVCYFIY